MLRWAGISVFGAALLAAVYVVQPGQSSPAESTIEAARPVVLVVGPGDQPDVYGAVVDAQAAVAAYLAEQDRLAVEAYLVSVHEEEVRRAAARAPARPAAASGSTLAPSSGSCAGDVECFLACTIDHESRSAGVYTAVSPGGTYRGAYQFDQPTWNNAVANAGYPQYVGVPPNLAPPEVQDAAATWLYSVAGNRPWGGRC